MAKPFHVVNGCCVNHRDAGAPVTQVRDNIYQVDIIARATDEQRVSLSTLRDLQVPLPGGRTVPLSQVATFEYAQDLPRSVATRPCSDLDRPSRRRAGGFAEDRDRLACQY